MKLCRYLKLKRVALGRTDSRQDKTTLRQGNGDIIPVEVKSLEIVEK